MRLDLLDAELARRLTSMPATTYAQVEGDQLHRAYFLQSPGADGHGLAHLSFDILMGETRPSDAERQRWDQDVLVITALEVVIATQLRPGAQVEDRGLAYRLYSEAWAELAQPHPEWESLKLVSGEVSMTEDLGQAAVILELEIIHPLSLSRIPR